MAFTPVVAFAVLSLISTVTAIDECLNHETAETLPDLDRRSRLNDARTSVNSQPIIEDRLVSSSTWYSTVGSGGIEGQYLMTDSNHKPEPLHCGTYYPLYLKENHPEPAENVIVEVEACAVDFSSECFETKTVKIRRCGGLFQYQMEGSSANSAYCFDHPLMDDEETQPPDYQVPEVKVDHALEYDRTNPERFVPYLAFYCRFEIQTIYVYRVDWYVNNQLIKETGPVASDNLEATYLLERDLIAQGYTLGISIKCSARVAKRSDGLSTVARFSEGFFAGVKVYTSTSEAVLKLDAKEEGYIYLQNTVPVGLNYEQIRFGTKGALVQMYDPTKDYHCTDPSVAVFENLDDYKTCGTIIPAFEYEDYIDAQGGTYRGNTCVLADCKDYQVSNVSFKVSTSRHLVYGDNNAFTIRLRVDHRVHPIWDGYKLSDIKVLVQDTPQWFVQPCSSHIDPHMVTADGVGYENQNPGTYVLYKNEEYDTEVQEKNIACLDAFCTCSVIIRSGGDMFKIDVCEGDKPDKPDKLIHFITCQTDQEILDVRKIDDKKYRILTPIGTLIQVEIRSWGGGTYLNTDIYMSPKDINRVQGLCGDFNGQKANDLKLSTGTFHDDPPPKYNKYLFHPNTFTRSWRIDGNGDSFWLIENQSPGPWRQNRNLCVCPYVEDNDKVTKTVLPNDGDKNEILCSPVALNCGNPLDNDSDKHPRICKVKNKRRRRSTDVDSGEVSETHKLEKRSLVENATLAYEKGLVECGEYVRNNSKVRKYNAELPNADLFETRAIEECAADYQYNATDDELKAAHLGTLISAYDISIRINKTFQEERAAIVTEFNDENCPDDCSGQGTCVSGKCVCDSGYGGSACAYVRSQLVSVQGIDGGETCDEQDEECNTFRVSADPVLDGFTCQIKETKKFTGSADEEVRTYTTSGTGVSLYAGDCSRRTSQRQKRSTVVDPFFTIIDVSISNDGSTFGGSGRVYIYDSQCQFYTTTQSDQASVSLKEGTCFIAGACRSQGEVSTSDSCFACDPTSNSYNWTVTCTSAESTADNKEALIIGLSVTGGVLLLLIVAVIIIAVIKRVNKRKRCPSPGPGNCRFRSKGISETKVSKVNENPYQTPLPPPDREYSTISLHVTDSNYANMM